MAEGASHASTDSDAYRPDIDGLRAVAVLGVVAYHLGLCGGGFVGVDIFFVISGYLITRILIGELASGKLGASNLARFYERRVRRIMPALAVMCVVTYAAAMLWLFPEDLIEFGRSLQSVAVFISNIHFQRKTGYFDGAADEKPLLHTWSLAVEEQYYLLFPLALWMVWHWRGPAAAFAVCLIVALGSLAYAEIQVRSTPEIAFFSTPSRMWELLTGALLAMVREQLPATRVLRETMAVAGAVMVGWSYATYSSATSFPGLGAVVPVLGSALLIAAGAKDLTLVSRVLAAPVLVGIGLISYSVYLWHWPLMVFAKYRFAPLLEQDATTIPTLLFAASLLLGYLSWRFVEQPFRRPPLTRRSSSRTFAVQTALILVMVVAGVALSRLGGLSGRWPDDVLLILNQKAAAKGSELPNCRPARPERFEQIRVCKPAGSGSETAEAVLLWGDSHAAMLKDALVQYAGKEQAILSAVSPGCPPLADVVLNHRTRRDKCRSHNAAVLEYLAQVRPRVSIVILVARWTYYAGGARSAIERRQDVILGEGDGKDAPLVLQEKLTATLRSLLKHVDRIVLLAPFPESQRPVAVSIARAHAWGHPPITTEVPSAVTRRQASSLEALENAVRIDPLRIKLESPLSYFCDPQACDFAGADGRPLFTDTNHLSASGIARIAPLLESMLAASWAKER